MDGVQVAGRRDDGKAEGFIDGTAVTGRRVDADEGFVVVGRTGGDLA